MTSGAARFAILAALTLFACSDGRAAVSVSAHAGFGGIFRLGSAFPLRVEVVNDGPAIAGVLEIVEARGGPTRGMPAYVLTHRRELFLSAHARKIVRVTVDPDTVAKPLRVRFLTGDNRVETTVSLRGRFTPQPIMLLLTRSNVSPVIPLPYDSPVPVVSLTVPDLPDDLRAYSGVWSVMLYEESLRALSRPQRRALESWLTAGGTLLVLGGLHYALYQEPTTAGLLPVRVRGLRKIDGLPGLAGSYGDSTALPGTFYIQEAIVTGGNVLMAEQDTPIWVEQQRGRGKVAYLAVDVGRPPVSEWAGLGDLLKNILGPPPGNSSETRTVWNRSVFTGMIEEFGFVSVAGSVAAFFLGLLLYLGSLVCWFQLWQKRSSRRGVLTFSLGALVFLFAVAGYAYFDRGNYMPDAVLVSSTVIDGDPWSKGGTVHSDVGLFSTRKRDFTFRVDKGWTHLDYLPPAGGVSESPVFVHDSLSASRISIPLNEWASGLFKLRGTEPFPVRIEWRKLKDRYAVSVWNLGGIKLTECWLVIAGQGFDLGDIPPGGRVVREVPTQEGGSSAESLRLRDIPSADKAREVLLHKSIFPAEDPGMDTGQTAFVFGWVDGHHPEVRVDDQRIRTHHYKLFRASIPLGSEEDL